MHRKHNLKIQKHGIIEIVGNFTFAELILMEIDGIRELDPKFYKDGIVDRDRVGVQFLAIYQR